jgi:TonB family protein
VGPPATAAVALSPGMPHSLGGEAGDEVTVRWTHVHGVTLAGSLGLHAVIGAGLFWLALRSLSAEPRAPEEPSPPAAEESGLLTLELPAVGAGTLLEDRPVDPTGEPPRASGGATVAHLDTGRAGHGGDAHVPVPALNLADGDERMRLSPDLLSRLDRDQLQRMRVARVRQSWEDRRATTHPTELTLLVTGSATLLERRPAALLPPSRGALESPSPSVLGAAVGASPVREAGDTEPLPGGAYVGSLLGAPGAGVDGSRAGTDHRTAAPIGSARPDVTLGPVAVPAHDSARPRDDVDSDQEVASTVRSLLHASTAGGAPGEGQGGNGGGGEAGAGASLGVGSRARPMGIGGGDVLDFWTSDPRLVPYFRRLHGKIDPLWANAFPRSALLELKQGTVILQFVVQADGRATVQWPPLRPSGVDEFDRNCADAIRRAAPFPPIPHELGVSTLTIRAPFVASNPAVR